MRKQISVLFGTVSALSLSWVVSGVPTTFATEIRVEPANAEIARLQNMQSREKCRETYNFTGSRKKDDVEEHCKQFPPQAEIDAQLKEAERTDECYRKHERTKLNFIQIAKLCGPMPKFEDKKMTSNLHKIHRLPVKRLDSDTVPCKISADRSIAICGEDTYRREKGMQIFNEMHRRIQKEAPSLGQDDGAGAIQGDGAGAAGARISERHNKQQ